MIAAVLLAVWQRCLGEYQKLDREKLVSSAPALAGEGMIGLAEFCGLTSASLQQVAQRLLDANIPLFWLAILLNNINKDAFGEETHLLMIN
ncbi:hypothetical protein RSA31_17470 [Pantoea dispersa]|nr:hypothetical protein NS215_03120 [Pantoea dispersa]KTS86564.1 hypothetical protein RSA31_17470 [Pantoea dispersa]